MFLIITIPFFKGIQILNPLNFIIIILIIKVSIFSISQMYLQDLIIPREVIQFKVELC